MSEILESIGAVLWIALAVYSFYHIRRQNRRLNKLLDYLERAADQ